MSERGKRRRWSDGEKLEICGQARVPGVSVAQVARRYALNANMLHAWLRDPRFANGDEGLVDASDVGADEDADEAAGSPFYEVSVSSAAIADPIQGEVGVLNAPVPTPVVLSGIHASRVDLVLSDGRRVLIEGAMSLAAIVTLVEGLAE